MWIAHNATITTTGTLPGLDPGTVELTLSYDYEQKMEKHEFKTGQDAGKTVVFRWDKKDPGEPWSRAYVVAHAAVEITEGSRRATRARQD